MMTAALADEGLMQFQSTFVRRYWLTVAGTAIADAILSGVLASLFFETFWVPFGLIFGFLMVWPMIYGVRTALYNVAFSWFTRRTSIDDLKREFRKNDLPNKLEGFSDADYYFQSVIDDNKAPEKAKIFAAATLGSLSTMRQYAPVDTMRSYSRIEQALKEYSDTLPRPQVTIVEDKVELEDEEELEDGDQEKITLRIMAKCNMGMPYAKLLSGPNETHELARPRYETARDACLKMLLDIDEEFYHDFSSHQIIKLCVAAGELDTAKELLSDVEEDHIRNLILEEAPALRD